MGEGRRRNPPTTRETRAQGDGDRDNEPIGGPRTAEPPHPQRGEVADDGSKETPTRHSSGTDGAMPEHSALPRRKYSFLTPAGMVVDPANAGDPGSKASHGATVDQYGRDPEEEGDETQQRALPARGNN